MFFSIYSFSVAVIHQHPQMFYNTFFSGLFRLSAFGFYSPIFSFTTPANERRIECQLIFIRHPRCFEKIPILLLVSSFLAQVLVLPHSSLMLLLNWRWKEVLGWGAVVVYSNFLLIFVKSFPWVWKGLNKSKYWPLSSWLHNEDVRGGNCNIDVLFSNKRRLRGKKWVQHLKCHFALRSASLSASCGGLQCKYVSIMPEMASKLNKQTRFAKTKQQGLHH